MNESSRKIEPGERSKLALKFIIPSLIGILLFVFPIKYDGDWTISISIVSNYFKAIIKPYVPVVATVVYFVSALGAFWTKLAKPKIVLENSLLRKMFVTSWGYVVLRLFAAVIAVLILLGTGPEMLIGSATGAKVLKNVVPNSITLLSTCAFALPLLLEFGLMQFVGIMVNKVFRKLFKLPGNATVDCISSWLGGANMAVILTDSQYTAGIYSRRESAIIMACFSAGSISSALVLLGYGGIENLFVPFYLTVTVLGIICAIIFSRVPPLSRFKDSYYNGEEHAVKDDIPEGHTRAGWAYENALLKAKESYTLKSYFRDALSTVVTVFFKVSPVLLAVGTVALILAEYTNVYYYLGIPFMPFFYLIGAPEATAAAGTMMSAFADNYIPSIIASSTVVSPYTKFVIALASYNAIIYMTGNGSVMMQSETEVSLLQCFIIFIERTIFTIVIGGLVGRLIFTLAGMPI